MGPESFKFRIFIVCFLIKSLKYVSPNESQQTLAWLLFIPNQERLKQQKPLNVLNRVNVDFIAYDFNVLFVTMRLSFCYMVSLQTRVVKHAVLCCQSEPLKCILQTLLFIADDCSVFDCLQMDDEASLLPRKLQAALEQALEQRNDIINQDSDSESDEGE